MPRRLIDRCQPDSIREFRASAGQRYYDGLALAGAGNRTAAVYLWGYAAEMTLKAAYFELFGLAEDDELTVPGHIQPAINRGRAAPLNIAWPHQGAGHNVRAWAELLVGVRALDPGTAYGPAFAVAVQRCGQRIGQLWKETLRYHKNRAYLYEVRQVREATEWLLINSADL
ncbi:MAG TPA: hypothetical protein VEL76_42655 [Gemmataceae bacterium]|nr:hypothetical protein [Gemmataceae bacterium]